MNNATTISALIIGGGPAGSQCALWLNMLGHMPIILEQSNHLGGLQNASPYENHWIVGMPHTTGRELAHNIQQQISDLDIPFYLNHTVTKISQSASGFAVEAGDLRFFTRFIVIATGSKSQIQSTNSMDYQAAKQSSTNLKKSWVANLPKAFDQLKNQLLNQEGFIITDQQCRTPIHGIYAIGEAAFRAHPCVITSMADGVVAAKSIQSALIEL